MSKFRLFEGPNFWQPPAWEGLSIVTTRREFGADVSVECGGRSATEYLGQEGMNIALSAEKIAARIEPEDANRAAMLTGRLARSFTEALALHFPKVAAAVLLCVALQGCIGGAALGVLLKVGEGAAAASTIMKNEANCSLVAPKDCHL